MHHPTPLLVLGSGHRCGSTLIQRLLNSHPEVLIWGEHYGALNAVFQAMEDLGHWDREFGEVGREEFEQHGHQGWIAIMMPGIGAVERASRAYVVSMFAEPAQALGRPRWGFKEVRYGAEFATRFRVLFPNTRVVHITRDPRDVLRSLDSWEKAGLWKRPQIEQSLGFWLSVNQEFARLGTAPWLLSVRYENVVADPAAFTEQLAEFTGLEPAALDQSVFAEKVHGPGPAGHAPREVTPVGELEPRLRELIAKPRFIETAAEFGYELDQALAAGLRRRGRWAAGRVLRRSASQRHL